MLEKADVKKVVKDLQGNFAGSNDEQMKAVQLLKGLALSDEAISNEFMKKLDAATTKISKEVLGTKEESVIEIQEDVKIGNIVLEVGDRIQVLKENATLLGGIIIDGIDLYNNEYDDNIQIEKMHGAMTHDTVLVAKVQGQNYQIVIS